MAKNSASSSFYTICLLSVDSANAHLILALYCNRVPVNHNVADDSVDGSYHFGLQNSNGLLAQVQY
jgi:hypothetical protein